MELQSGLSMLSLNLEDHVLDSIVEIASNYYTCNQVNTKML